MSKREGKPQLSVPKFSSFKPKQPELPAPDEKDAGTGEGEHGERETKRHRHSHHDEHRSKRIRPSGHQREERHRDERHRDTGLEYRYASQQNRRPRSQSPKGRSEHRPERLATSIKDVKPNHFFVDVKGDPLIIKYGGIERAKIPSYRRYGAGRVLGTPGRLIIHRDGARDQFSLQMPGQGSHLFREKDGLRSKSSRARRDPVLLRARKAVVVDEEGEGYIAVEASKRKDRLSESEPSDTEARPDYRSIEGKVKVKPKPEVEVDSSDELVSEDEVPPMDQSNPLRWRSIQLSRRVKENPEDIPAWMELVDHQDALLRAGQTLDYQVLENEAHSYAEIKVSMLESALSHAADPRERLKVLNYLMREGIKVWNSKTVAAKWSEVLKAEDDDFELWKLHLDYSMSNIASFRFHDIKEMLLNRLRRAVTSNESNSARGFGQATYVFLRATKFLHDAGYKELAVAAWQGILELTFCRPPSVNGDKDALDAFEEFWESEVPRLGEEGALGWNSFHMSPGEAPEPAEYVPPQFEHSKDVYKSWAGEERWQADRARVPARTLDFGNDDDPFRVVMYSDIAPFLFYIPQVALPQVGRQLLDAFCIFYGLPPLSATDEWTALALEDPFLSEARMKLVVDHGKNNLDDEETVKRTPNFAPASMQVTNTPELLFCRGGWYCYLPQTDQRPSLNLDLVHNAVRQLVNGGAGTEDLWLYYLALSSAKEPASLKKLAKGLLKKHPTSFELYDGYALAEQAQNNLDTAKKILATATDLASKISSSAELCLWKTWAFMELDSGAKTLATKRLCSWLDNTLRNAPDDDAAVSSSYLLKAHRSFSSAVQNLAASGDADGAALHGECLALLAYLTADGCTEPMSSSQGNITAAIDSVATSIHALRTRGHGSSPAHEGLVQFAARLLYLNATRGPYRRGYLREQLLPWINDFPRNTILLSLFEWSDTGLRVVDETRSLLYDRVLVKPHDCTVSRVFAIEHELSRGNANTTRAAFEQAVASDACKNNIQVWIAYIRFCYEHRNLRSRAKDVFYRALRHCTWSKDVMMEAFGTLVRIMESEELKSIFAMMTSKGLRVHIDLDDYLEARWAERAADSKRK